MGTGTGPWQQGNGKGNVDRTGASSAPVRRLLRAQDLAGVGPGNPL